MDLNGVEGRNGAMQRPSCETCAPTSTASPATAVATVPAAVTVLGGIERRQHAIIYFSNACVLAPFPHPASLFCNVHLAANVRCIDTAASNRKHFACHMENKAPTNDSGAHSHERSTLSGVGNSGGGRGRGCISLLTSHLSVLCMPVRVLPLNTNSALHDDQGQPSCQELILCSA